MYFEEFGNRNKKTVIFIHGAMWPRSFERQKSLSKYFHTVFIHMDGHGVEYDNSFQRGKTVDEIIAYIKQNDIDKPHIAGFSLGTQIAMVLADSHYKLIDKVALISPLADAGEEDISAIKFTMKALASLVKIKPLATIASKVLDIETSGRQQFYEEMKNQSVVKLAEDIMKERLEFSAMPNLFEICNPFYIAAGLKDMQCFIKSAHTLKKNLKNSVLSLYENCGHNIPISYSARLNNELKIFFKNEEFLSLNCKY